MSLLLDALKKAADDKQKASEDSSAEQTHALADSPESGSTAAQAADQAGNKTTGSDIAQNGIAQNDITQNDLKQDETPLTMRPLDDEQGIAELTEELTLDVLDADTAEPVDNAAAFDQAKAEDVNGHDVEALALQQKAGAKKTEPTSYTVSDEALSLLIDKTNRDVKNGRRIVLFSMLLLSLIILVSGGVFYYMDMQAEIAALERKHQIAMQSMRSKTNRDKTPEQSEIIRKLVSESELDDKVQYAKQHTTHQKKTQQVKRRPAVARTAKATKATTTSSASTVSFQKTNKTDPVAEKLDEAWFAYEAGQYGQAKELYKDVLRREENNRDALLGLGAIAVIEKDPVVARDVYLSLLKQDPRDPIAVAALASLQNDKVSLAADEKFLLDMLQKNPDATQLHFALGNIYAQQKKWKSAQQSYFNAWQHDAENADYVFNLAVSMDQLGKPAEAVNFYRDSLAKAKNKQVSFSREAVQKRITELSEL